MRSYPPSSCALFLSDHRDVPREDQTDWSEKAAALFVSSTAKPVRSTTGRQKGTGKTSDSGFTRTAAKDVAA